MKNDYIRHYWLGFLVAAVGIAWLIWLWRKKIEVTPKPLYITGRTAAYPLTPRTPKPTTPKVDDLSLIQGIGPAYAKRLNEAGIKTFADLASADPEHLREVTGVSRWDPNDWITQAGERA